MSETTRKVTIDVIEAGAAADADQFLSNVGDAMFYATSAYRGLLERFTGSTARYAAARDGDGKIVAMLPAFTSVPAGAPPVMNSLPFYGSNGGIVGSFSEGVSASLIADFDAQARTQGCAAATIISSPFDSLEQIQWYRDHTCSDLQDERIGQITFLPTDASALPVFVEQECHLMVRRALKKARQLGVTVMRTDREGLPFVAEVHRENMQSINGRAKPARFFDLVGDVLDSDRHYGVFTAFIGAEPVAALLVLYCNRTVEYFTPVIKAEHRSSQALSLVIYEAMHQAIAAGYRQWNWGGTWATQDGVYAFKNRWAARDMPYHYFTRVYDRAVLQCTQAELLERYPYFYVVPFSALGSRS
jgi:hypothetical protein